MSYIYKDDQMIELPDGYVAWSGSIYANGKLICKVYNKGDGGCNQYDWAEPHNRYEFEAVAMTKYPEGYEPMDAYVADLWEASLV